MSDDSSNVPAEGKTQGEIEFQFETDPFYRIMPANGAMIGPTPRGEMKIDFFVESVRLPTKVVNKITESYGIGDIVRQEPSGAPVAVRRLQVGILISLTQAGELARLMSMTVKNVLEEQ